MREPTVRGCLSLCEFHLLCERGVEHPRRKKSGQSPVLETLRNDRVACLRFRRAERQVDGFAQTLWGETISTCLVDDPLLELLHRLPIFGWLELTHIFFFALVVHRCVHGT